MAVRFPDLAETQPELLAQHYTEAGLAEQAIGYWQRAGERSQTRSAYVEVVAHFMKALEVLKTLPNTPARARHELTLLLTLALALRATKGFAVPEVGHAFARARELCRQVEDTPQICDILVGLSSFYVNRGEFQTARELIEQSLTLAQRLQGSVRLMQVHEHLGNVLYFWVSW